MSFSSDAWERNFALYETTRSMPFNCELANGQLDETTFKHYMIQDSHYLVAFGRALAATPPITHLPSLQPLLDQHRV
jgi:thiaminase (transcriptional activator TenA)